MDEDAELAFSQLVRRHEGGVRRFLQRLSGHSADDLAQEVFIRAWRHGGSWRGTGTYKSWLLGIAWTQFLHARRADQRRVARESDWETAPPPMVSTDRIDIEMALATLNERERAAAILCFGEEFSHGEAAAIMGVPLGTLKSIVARARAKLVERLEMVDD